MDAKKGRKTSYFPTFALNSSDLFSVLLSDLFSVCSVFFDIFDMSYMLNKNVQISRGKQTVCL